MFLIYKPKIKFENYKNLIGYIKILNKFEDNVWINSNLWYNATILVFEFIVKQKKYQNLSLNFICYKNYMFTIEAFSF